MTVAEAWKCMVLCHEQLVETECLCNVVSSTDLKKVMNEILKIRSKDVVFNEEETCDLQLLALTVIKVIGEVCARANENMLCHEVFSMAEYLQDSSVLDTLVNNVMNENNKFVCRALLKALTTSLYLLQSWEFSGFIKKLLELVKTCSQGVNASNLLNVFELLLCFSNKSSHVLEASNSSDSCGKGFTCKRKVQGSVTCVEELRNTCCLEMSSVWPVLMERFFCENVIVNENHVFVSFLCMWRTVAQIVSLKNDISLTKIMLNKESLVKHFVCLMPTTPASLKLFVGIVNMAFPAESLCRLANEGESNECDEAEPLISSINTGLLEDICVTTNASGFIGVNLHSDKVESGHQKRKADGMIYEWDEITARKLVLILLKVFSEAVVSQSLLLAFQKTEDFVAIQLKSCIEKGVYSWILALFLDQDNDLLEAMLSSLLLYKRISVFIRDKNDAKWTKLKNSLDPHKMFIKFLEKLGYDHHTLLEFLMSNDTCILTYLVLYLRHLASDCHGFIEAHNVLNSGRLHLSCLVEDMTSRSLKPSMETDEKFVKMVSFPPTSEETEGFPSSPLSHVISLVAYSNSSSSDSDDSGCDDEISFRSTYNTSLTITTFKNLRLTIEKFMECKEFPYNAQPLLKLLKKCELQHSE